jgi:5,5'-dehydrodivanillate O-demethylase
VIREPTFDTSPALRFEGNKKGAWEDLVRTAPGTPMGTLLRKFWQPVALAAEVSPGKALPIRIMSEDLTLYRGDTGTPHVVASRCAHRSTLLYIGWVEGDCIRCRYHGWKYDGSGQCVEMPAEDPSFPPKVKILSYPAREYAGLIFAFMGEGAPPEFPHKAELDRDYGVKWAISMTWPCNWFQRLENSVDAAHVSFVHQGSAFGDYVTSTVPTLEYEETEWGIRQIARRSADNVRISEVAWPNCNHIPVPISGVDVWVDMFNWFVPVDDEHTAFLSSLCAPVRGEAARDFERRLASRWPPYNPADQGQELFAGRGFPSEVEDIVNAQDYLVQVGQGTIVDRSQERLGRSDAGIILMRKLFQRELEAIKQGLPGKEWKPRTGFARLPVPPGVPLAPDSGTAV